MYQTSSAFVSLLINKRRNVSVHGKLGGIIVVINKTNISINKSEFIKTLFC